MKILLTEQMIDPVDEEGLRILRNIGEVKLASSTKEEVLMDEVRDADALLVRFAKVTRNVIEKAEKLKVIGRPGTGVDNIDVQAATENGIMVVNVPALNADAVAEYTFGLILALTKNIVKADVSLRKGNWQIRNRIAVFNTQLSGKKLGIIGLGAIGTRVARTAKAFKMEILAYSPHVSTDKAREIGAKSVDLDSLLRNSDIITIHTALRKETCHMIGEEELKLMKKSVFLINCARGEIIDEKALITALKEERLAGAALDVFEQEPLDYNSPLIKLQNTVITPHIAGFTKEVRTRTVVTLAEDLTRALRGELPKNLVNREGLAGQK